MIINDSPGASFYSSEGGPVPPTHKETYTDYVYFLTMNAENKVARMVKV